MYSEMNSGQFETDFTVRDFSGYHTFRSGQSKAGVTPRHVRGASDRRRSCPSRASAGRARSRLLRRGVGAPPASRGVAGSGPRHAVGTEKRGNGNLFQIVTIVMMKFDRMDF